MIDWKIINDSLLKKGKEYLLTDGKRVIFASY